MKLIPALANGLFIAAALCAGISAAAPARADVLVTTDGKQVKFWNTGDGTATRTVSAGDAAISSIAAARDGKLIATGSADGKVRLLLTSDGSESKSWDTAGGAVTRLALSPDGKTLLVGKAKSVDLYKTADQKLSSSLDTDSDGVVDVIAAPDMIITGGKSGTVKIWDGAGNLQMPIPTGHEGGLTAMAGNHEKQVLYTGGADGKLKYWSQDGIGEFTGAQGSAIRAIAVVQHGAIVVTGGADGKLRAWDAAGHNMVKTIDDAHTGGVLAIALSPDGTSLATSGADKKIKIWSTADGTLLRTIEAGDAPATALVYVPEAAPAPKP